MNSNKTKVGLMATLGAAALLASQAFASAPPGNFTPPNSDDQSDDNGDHGDHDGRDLPEPPSIAIFAAGLAVIGVLRRRHALAVK